MSQQEGNNNTDSVPTENNDTATTVPVNHVSAKKTLFDEAKDLKEDGNQLFKQDKYTEAIAKYTEAEDKSREAFLEVRQAMDKEKLDQVLELFHTIYHNISLCYLKMEMAPQAAEYSAQAIRFSPTNVKPYFILGKASRMMGRYSYAKAVLEKCLSMQPDNEDTKKELELVKSKMDEMPDINQMLRNMNMGGMGGMGMGMGMHSNPYQKSLEDQEKEDFEKAVALSLQEEKSRQEKAEALAKVDAEQDEMKKFFEAQKKKLETPLPENEVGEEVFELEDEDFVVEEDDDDEDAEEENGDDEEAEDDAGDDEDADEVAE